MTAAHEVDLRHSVHRAFEAGRSVWGPDWRPDRAAVAPGRIEILGNHVDYNGGPVLAAAIDRATVVLSDSSPQTEMLFADIDPAHPRAYQVDSPERQRSGLGTPEPLDFALGVLARAHERGRSVRTGRSVVVTSIPIGSGMSSSAALSIALTLAMTVDPPHGVELIYDAQFAENWCGVPCGTMDQSASVIGQVIRFDGPEGSSQIAPDLGDFGFVVVDSRVPRTLGTSSYPLRVRECAEAVSLVRERSGRQIAHLAELDSRDLARIEQGEFGDFPHHLIARTRHVVTEVDRVAKGEEAMRRQDWHAFGRLMTQSGGSSAGDYAISHPDVESLVAVMRSVPGVVGARMMGGGEGGAVLGLLRRDSLGALQQTVAEFFGDLRPDASIRPLTFAPGARLIAGDDLRRTIQ